MLISLCSDSVTYVRITAITIAVRRQDAAALQLLAATSKGWELFMRIIKKGTNKKFMAAYCVICSGVCYHNCRRVCLSDCIADFEGGEIEE